MHEEMFRKSISTENVHLQKINKCCKVSKPPNIPSVTHTKVSLSL